MLSQMSRRLFLIKATKGIAKGLIPPQTTRRSLFSTIPRFGRFRRDCVFRASCWGLFRAATSHYEISGLSLLAFIMRYQWVPAECLRLYKVASERRRELISYSPYANAPLWSVALYPPTNPLNETDVTRPLLFPALAWLVPIFEFMHIHG